MNMSEYVKLAVRLVSVIYVSWLKRIHLDFFSSELKNPFKKEVKRL